jgi:hypothetical protein
MWGFLYFKRQLSTKKVGGVLCSGVPLCGQVEGVLDGVALS